MRVIFTHKKGKKNAVAGVKVQSVERMDNRLRRLRLG